MRRGYIGFSTARVLSGLRDVCQDAKPYVMFVNRDTATSMAAVLSSFINKFQLSISKWSFVPTIYTSPWPEELNRQITSRIATYNLAPTPLSKENLLNRK